MNNTYELWRGPSRLTGDEIIVLASGFTRPSTNRKTGPMIQTWILRADRTPHEALRTKHDDAVCGDCQHRGTSCYVTVFQAPTTLWRQWAAGKVEAAHPFALPKLGTNRHLRLGAYGDPAAAPTWVWRQFTSKALGFTGYTHQWARPETDPDLREFCMASVDTPAQALKAKAAGWRTFRVKTDVDDRGASEAVCPAIDEAGHKLQCIQCMACCGTTGNRRGDIVINVHGSQNRIVAFYKKTAEGGLEKAA